MDSVRFAKKTIIQKIAKVRLKLLDYRNLSYHLAMETEQILKNPEGCPWAGWDPATIKYCEAHLCSWVKSPADTWSCLGFVLIGVWLLTREPFRKGNALALIGPIAIFTGVFSGLYHASFSFFFQMFDLASMFLFSSLLFSLNLRRLGWFQKGGTMRFYVVMNLVSIALVLLIRQKSGQVIFGAQMIAGILIEARLSMRNRGLIRYRWFWANLGIFAVAYAFWFTDTRRIICDPDNHIYQGHAVWHVINSFCFLALYHFYRQFPEVRMKPLVRAGGS